jgi:hypothetical protein
MMRMIRSTVLLALLLLGVGTASAQNGIAFTGVVSQRFQNGEMLYRQDSGEIIVFYSSSQTWESFPSEKYGNWPDNGLTAPTNFYAPMFGFGKVWANNTRVRQGLGWAVLPEIGYETRIVTIQNYVAVYYGRLDGRFMQANANGSWVLTSTSPVPAEASGVRISLTVNPTAISIGQPITVTWQVQGAQSLVVEIFDATAPAIPIMQSSYSVDWTGGLVWTVPETVHGDLIVTVYAANIVYTQSEVTPSYLERIASRSATVNLTSPIARLDTNAAYEQFQHGFMLWRQDTGEVRVFMDDGTWTGYPQAIYGESQNFSGDLPAGCVRPVNAFGRVFGYLNGWSPLGCAIAPEVGFDLVIQTGDNLTYTLADGRVITLGSETWQ